MISAYGVLESDMSTTEYYNILKKLGYNYERYSKIKNKFFYKELNYKSFVHNAMEHLKYELEQEEKQIISEMQYDLTNYN